MQKYAKNKRKQKTQTPKLESIIYNLQNAISCTKRRSSKMGGGGNRAAWRIQIINIKTVPVLHSMFGHSQIWSFAYLGIRGQARGVSWPQSRSTTLRGADMRAALHGDARILASRFVAWCWQRACSHGLRRDARAVSPSPCGICMAASKEGKSLLRTNVRLMLKKG